MHLIPRVSLIIILIVSWASVNAQAPDTLSLAAELNAQQSFDDAIELLEAYQNDHGDFESLRMLAETHYWNQDFQAATEAFNLALEKFPQQYRLHLELGRVLVARNALKQARNHLEHFLDSLPAHPEANYLMAVTNYWMGRIHHARNYLRLVLSQSPDYQDALDLDHLLRELSAPTIGVSIAGFTDDQPLEAFGPSISLEMYRSALFAPEVDVQWRDVRTIDGSSFLEAQLKNTFRWWQPDIELTLGAGILSQDDVNLALWQATLRKRFLKAYALTLSAERTPYTWTATSLQQIPAFDAYQLALSRTDAEYFQFELSGIHHRYHENLQSNTLYGWLLSPPLNNGKLKLRAGYSYTYADSDGSTFVAAQSLVDIIQNFDPQTPIEGIFDRFFTPEENHTHTLLGDAEFRTRKFTLRVHAGIGVYARADQPYLYLNSVDEELVVLRDFYQEKYTPLNVECALRYSISEAIWLQGNYAFFRSLFYRRHDASLGLTFRLIGHEQ